MDKVFNYVDYSNIKASDFKKKPIMIYKGTMLISLPVFNVEVFKSRPNPNKKSFSKWCEFAYTEMSTSEVRARLNEYKKWAMAYIAEAHDGKGIKKIEIIAPKNRKKPAPSASFYALNNQMIAFYERLDNFAADAVAESFNKSVKLSYYKYKSPTELMDHIEDLLS